MRYLFALAIIISGVLLVASKASAHEMVPTYPRLQSSYLDGLQVTTMTLFNRRSDVEFYEIGVFTEDWEEVRFVSQYTIHKIPYLSTVSFDIYIRDEDKYKARYICSKSKLRKADGTIRTAVSSRICSKVKRAGEK